jgi:hypothetical protein
MKRRLVLALSLTSLALALVACADVPVVEVMSVATVPPSTSTTSTAPTSTTPTTECQDHELLCAGPPGGTTTTVPVLDPAMKDETEIGGAASQFATTTTPVTLPRTS